MNFELKGVHVLAVLLGFFGVTFAVNGIFITYAVSTFSGEDVDKPYLRGLAYNETLDERAAQAALKWTASVYVVREGASDAVVTVSVRGADGKPRSGLTVEAALRRPTDARLDQTLTLEYAGDGVYRGTAKNIAAGQWDVIARTTANGSPFEAERRVLLK